MKKTVAAAVLGIVAVIVFYRRASERQIVPSIDVPYKLEPDPWLYEPMHRLYLCTGYSPTPMPEPDSEGASEADVPASGGERLMPSPSSSGGSLGMTAAVQHEASIGARSGGNPLAPLRPFGPWRTSSNISTLVADPTSQQGA